MTTILPAISARGEAVLQDTSSSAAGGPCPVGPSSHWHGSLTPPKSAAETGRRWSTSAITTPALRRPRIEYRIEQERTVGVGRELAIGARAPTSLTFSSLPTGSSGPSSRPRVRSTAPSGARLRWLRGVPVLSFALRLGDLQVEDDELRACLMEVINHLGGIAVGEREVVLQVQFTKAQDRRVVDSDHDKSRRLLRPRAADLEACVDRLCSRGEEMRTPARTPGRRGEGHCEQQVALPSSRYAASRLSPNDEPFARARSSTSPRSPAEGTVSMPGAWADGYTRQ